MPCRSRFRLLCLLGLLLFAAPAANGKCLPIEQAPEHVGAVRCVTGKVVAVNEGRSGTHFLNFCDDWQGCPFAVVVFAGNLKHVGDIKWLVGRTIEIHGRIQSYHGQAEIILRDARQLRGEAAKLPPLPRTYDVSRRGSHSAGQFRRPRPVRTRKQKPTAPEQTEQTELSPPAPGEAENPPR